MEAPAAWHDQDQVDEDHQAIVTRLRKKRRLTPKTTDTLAAEIGVTRAALEAGLAGRPVPVAVQELMLAWLDG
jgi:hypothetical protein